MLPCSWESAANDKGVFTHGPIKGLRVDAEQFRLGDKDVSNKAVAPLAEEEWRRRSGNF